MLRAERNGNWKLRSGFGEWALWRRRFHKESRDGPRFMFVSNGK